MCLLSKARLLKQTKPVETLWSKKLSFFIVKNIRITSICSKPLCFCLYSTETGKEGLKGLTDEILKSKTASAKQTTDDAQVQSEPPQDSGQKSKKESKWFGKNAWKLGLIMLSGWAVFSTSGLLYIWGAPPIDPEGFTIEDEFSDLPVIEAYYKRAYQEFRNQKRAIQDPSRDKLLPDPLQHPYVQPPYTLVIEMTGVLVHPDWTYGTGWRFKKRPGIEYFLKQVGPPLFEVVVYTSEQGFNADAILNNLDQQGYIMYRLYRDATRYMNGHHVKDLGCLNRDLSKVIIVDHDPRSFQLHPKNAFRLERWRGEDGDTTLIDLAHFLQTLAVSGVEDVRSVLQYYNECDEPIAKFRENQDKLRAEQTRLADIQSSLQDKKRSGPLAWTGLFGKR